MSRHAGATEVVVREKAPRQSRRVCEAQWAFSVGQLGPKLLVHHVVQRDLKVFKYSFRELILLPAQKWLCVNWKEPISQEKLLPSAGGVF